MDSYELAIEKLANHANLPIRAREESLRGESLLYHLWVADRDRNPPQLARFFDDILDCFAVLNTRLNGPDPNIRKGPRSEPVPEDVAYSVACILEACLEYYGKWSENHFLQGESLRAM